MTITAAQLLAAYAGVAAHPLGPGVDPSMATVDQLAASAWSLAMTPFQRHGGIGRGMVSQRDRGVVRIDRNLAVVRRRDRLA